MRSMDIFEKVVSPARRRLWTQGDEFLCGFVARHVDVSWARTSSEVLEAHGYAADDPLFAGEPFVDVLRFHPRATLTFVPATGAVDGGGEGFVGLPPFTGTGFSPTTKGLVPLWWVEPTRVPAGSELWRIHTDGREEFLSAYANVASGWQPGQGRALPSDVCGTFSRWKGVSFLADELENDRVVLASFRPFDGGKATERGLWAHVVEAEEIEDVHALRLTATLNGLRFQVARRWNDGTGTVARLVYIGRDAPSADDAGLERVDAGVYETTARLEDVTDVRGEELVRTTA